METIAVFNTRGGSGKSAATVFLADFLASSFKKRVLVVDLDPQQSSSVALLGEEQVNAEVGAGKCLATILQHEIVRKKRSPSDVRTVLMERPQGEGPGRSRYLGPVHVMASNRPEWKELDAYLHVLSEDAEKDANRVLLDVLKSLETDFDICLIDFPAHDTGPITKNGLRAAGWWIFPCVPDRSGTRDIEGPIGAFREAIKGTKHKPKGLGTLLSICQPGNTRQFKQTVSTLNRLVDGGYLPRLFGNKMLSWPAARDALDDTRWDHRTTLAMKYGGTRTSLYKAANRHAKEVVSRLKMPVKDGEIQFPRPGWLNKHLTELTKKTKKLFGGGRGK